jgi:hypothetical protein
MALIVKDRVQETANSPGTGTVTLLGAVTGFQAFSSIGSGNTTYYCIADQGGANWEVGIGTIGTGTLARTTILSSSNGGSVVNFSSGIQVVFCTYPAGRSVYQDESTGTAYSPALAASNGLFVNSATVSANYSIPSGSNALSAGPITVASGVTVTVPSGSTWVVV